jgi:hypothetical protein
MFSQLIFHHIQLKFTRPRHTLHHRLRHGGTGKARASLSCGAKVGQARVNRFHAPTLSQDSTRPALRAPYMHTRGHIRRRLSRPARYGAQVLHRRNLRSRAAPPDTPDPWRAPHVCRAEAIRNRASPGPGGTGLTIDIARGCSLSCLSS